MTLTNSGTAAVLIGSLLVAYQKYFIKKNVKSPLKWGFYSREKPEMMRGCRFRCRKTTGNAGKAFRTMLVRIPAWEY